MDYDIIIVGAGPAGLSSALHIAKLAPDLTGKVLVLEKQRHPRPKLCAGGILGDGEYILKRLGMNLTEVNPIPVDEARFLYQGRSICIKRDPAIIQMVRRDEFDAWLAQEAKKRKIAIQEETNVLRVERIFQGMKVVTDKGEYFCRVVIGADGSNSVVRKSMFPDVRCSMALGLEFLLHPEERKDRLSRRDRTAYFDFSKMLDGLQGYVWDFPTQLHGIPARTRGIYNACLYPNRLPHNLKTVLGRALFEENLNVEDFHLEGLAIRTFDPKKVFAVPGVILAGDAAGSDPIYGEGISFALGYGELAAMEIKEAFDRNDFTFTSYKKRILAHPMGRCLKRRVNLARMIYGLRSPILLKILWRHMSFLLKWYVEHSLIDWARDR